MKLPILAVENNLAVFAREQAEWNRLGFDVVRVDTPTLLELL